MREEQGAARSARLFADPEQRLAWLKCALCVGFAGGALVSWRVWLSTRFLPLTPAFSVPPTPFPFDYALLAGLLALLGWIAHAKRPSYSIAALLLLLAFLLLQDQGRLYPSVYEYFFMLSALALFGFSRSMKADVPLRTARLIVVCIYFWSGVQKINQEFTPEVLPLLIDPALHFSSSSAAMIWVLTFAGLAVPLFEIALGIGLLTQKYRSKALAAALSMHIFLFFAIGPFWNTWFKAAWEWNLVAGILVFVLFYEAKGETWKETLFQQQFLHGMVVLLFGVLPVLNFFNLWDSALAFNMFSGNATRGTVYVDDALVRQLPKEIRSHVRKDRRDRTVVDLDRLSQAEFNAGLYAEPRIFRRIARKFCAYAVNPDDAVLVIREKSGWLGTRPPQTFTCPSM